MKFTKYKRGSVIPLIRHINRTATHYNNPDIDFDKTKDNYSLLKSIEPDLDRYARIIESVHVNSRRDTTVLAEAIVTAPVGIRPENEKKFFVAVAKFLCEKFSEGNARWVVQATVHVDEPGENHLHFVWCPCVKNNNKRADKEYKVCVWQQITPTMLANIHAELQVHLNEHLDFDAPVHTGVTKASGGNRTMDQLKEQPRTKDRWRKKDIADRDRTVAPDYERNRW